MFEERMDAAPQIWREVRLGLELRGLLRSRLLDTHSGAGRGMPVLLIPGLLAADRTLGLLARHLKAHGFRPRRAGIESNIDCSEREMRRLTRRVERAAAESGSRVAIVGHSRGGIFGRTLAVRHPELVAGVVCLGSPLVDPLVNIHPLLHLQLELIARLGDRRIPRFASHACVDADVLDQLERLASRFPLVGALVGQLRDTPAGDCCRQFWTDSRAPLSPAVSYLSIYSRSDGVVSHEACLDPLARHLEVESSHCGMAFNTDVFKAIVLELRDVAEREREPVAAPPRRLAAVA
jgi:triacylglycerol lipase